MSMMILNMQTFLTPTTTDHDDSDSVSDAHVEPHSTDNSNHTSTDTHISDTPATTTNDNPALPDPDESLPPEEQASPTTPDDNLRELYDHQQMCDDEDYEFHSIVDHQFDKGVLVLSVEYTAELIDDFVLKVPFGVLKKDVPVELAKYIRNHVIESKRQGRYNLWAKSMLKSHTRYVRRLYRV